MDLSRLSDEELERQIKQAEAMQQAPAGFNDITGCTGDNCGDALANYLNTSHGYNLPRGGIGPGDVARLGKEKGAPVYRRGELSADTLTPGTIIHMTRQKGDRNYEYGATHIGIVDQGEGGPVFRSFTKGKGWRAEPVNPNFVNNLPAQVTATNPMRPGGNLAKYSDEELDRMIQEKSNPTKAQLAEAYGITPSPEPPKPIGVGERILGDLGIGVSESTGRAIGLGQLTGAAEAVGPAHGFEPGPYTQEEAVLARKEAEAAMMPAVGQRVLENPAETWLGRLGEGLVRTIPELPLFYGAGAGVNLGIRALALRGGGTLASDIATRGSIPMGEFLLPKLGQVAESVANYLSPEAVRAASLIGALPRVAAHGALTGATLGATTALPGERLEKAGEEALGFAVAAPAFHLAGKAIFGMAKAVGKGILKVPPKYKLRSEAEAKFENISEPMSRKQARKATKAEGVEAFGIGDKWYTGTRIEQEIPTTDVPAANVTGPTYSDAETASKAGDTTPFPSGVTFDEVKHKGTGEVSRVPNYTGLSALSKGTSKAQGLPAPEVGKMFPEPEVDIGPQDILSELPEVQARREAAQMTVDKVRDAAAEIFGTAEAPPTLVEEVKALQGVRREPPAPRTVGEEAVLRLNLNKAGVAVEPKEELSVTVGERTGKVKAEVVKKSKSPERDRVTQEISESYPRAAEHPQEVVVIQAIHEARARMFEKEGQGTREDYYKQKSFILGPQQEGVNEAYYAKDGRFITEFMPSSNLSTAFHAAWHYIEDTLPKDLIAELSKWRGKDYATWAVEDLEHTARAFERFWAEERVGKKELKEMGITPKIAKLFAKVKEWLLNVYGEIRNSAINVPLNRDLENVFRKALGLPEAAVPKAMRRAKVDIEANLSNPKMLQGFTREFVEPFVRMPEAQLDATLGEMMGPYKVGSPQRNALMKLADTVDTIKGRKKAGVVPEVRSTKPREEDLPPEQKAAEPVAPTTDAEYIKEGERLWDAYYNQDDLSTPEALRLKEIAEKFETEMKEKGVLFQRSAKDAYEEAGHLKSFSDDAEMLQDHTVRVANEGLDKVLFQASARKATKEERIAEKQAKDAKLDAEQAKAFTEGVRRAAENYRKVMDLKRVGDWPAQDITGVILKGEIRDLALATELSNDSLKILGAQLGIRPEEAVNMSMEQLVEKASMLKKESALIHTLLTHVFDRADALREANLASVEKAQIPKALEEMAKVNDTVEKWWYAFSTDAPHMLRETPGEKKLKAIAAWIEDRLGYSPKVLDKYTKAAYEAFVNMQHLSRRYPVLRPLFAFGYRKGVTRQQHELAFLQGDPDATVEGWFPSVSETGQKIRVRRTVTLPGISSYHELAMADPEGAALAKKILLAADRDLKHPRITTEYAMGAPELAHLTTERRTKVAQALGDIRETLDYTYFKLRSIYETSLEGKSPKQQEALMRAFDKAHEYHPNYFPHIREGSHVFNVLDLGGKPLFSTRSNSPKEIASLKADWTAKLNKELQKKLKLETTEEGKILLRNAYKDRISNFTTEDRSAQGINAMWLQQFATNLAEKAKSEGKLEEIQPTLDLLNRSIAAFGLRGQYIARSSAEGVPGFEEEIGKALISYGQMFSSHLANIEFTRSALKEIASLQGYGKLQSYARRWTELALQPSNKWDDAIAVAKNVAFMKYIGGVLKTAMVTTFDKITNAYPMMGMYVNNPKKLMLQGYREGASFMQWEHQVGKHLAGLEAEAAAKGIPFNKLEGLKVARKNVGIPKSLLDKDMPEGQQDWIVQGLLQLRKTGQAAPVFTNTILEGQRTAMDIMSRRSNMTGTVESRLQHAWYKSLDWSGRLIGTTESYGRLSTAVSAMRMFKQLGFTPEEAVKAGGQFMLDAHGYYGKINLPLWMQEKGFAQLAKLPFTFRVFEHHYINLIGGLLTGQQGKAGRVAAAKSLGLLAGLGGMMSLPFFTTAGKIFRATTGTDPEQYVRKQLNNLDNSQTLADMFSYGVPASGLGIGTPAISLRSSTEIGKIDTSELLLGAPGQVVSDVTKGASGAMSGDWNQFFDAVMPTVLKNPKRAYERYYYGALGASGKKITEGVGGEQIKYGPGEALGQVFGFTPAKMEKYYQQSEVAIADKEYWLSKRKALYRRLQRAFNTGDEDKMQSVFEDIAAYNQKAVSLGPDITLITPQEIRQSLKDRIEKKKRFLQAERLGLQ